MSTNIIFENQRRLIINENKDLEFLNILFKLSIYCSKILFFENESHICISRLIFVWEITWREFDFGKLFSFFFFG